MTHSFMPFGAMTPEDYARIGLRCGLEVHQQLLTDRKLFCRCPAGRYSPEFDAEVLRHMRPTLSELGEYDGTALMEKKTRKNILYRIKQDTVCTYEIDDTPPFFPDERAIDIAIEISLLLGLNMVGEMHVARKQYLDGSIPAGFQRTAILGVGGSIPYRDRTIGIRQLSIEEDSCREVADVGHDRVLLTDRLGMPLIEVVTEPDMRTPEEIAEVCQIIRLLCRSTHKVRTGYGAGRQDVNVSVEGGTRIEIKGVPQITRIPLLVHNEAMRQCALLSIRDELNARGVTADTFEWTSMDVTRSVSRTTYQPIRDAIARGHRVMGVLLRNFAGLLNVTTQQDTTFAKEFSDRVRVIACLTVLPNIVHSDTASELLLARDWKELRKRTKAGENDVIILVWGDERDTRTACEEIAIRAREATIGVPSDTRQALKDGTNGFERVLPGAERMYPDTDLPPMAVTAIRLDRVRAQLPEPIWDRMNRYRKLGIPDDTIEPLCVSACAPLFDRLTFELGIDPVFAAVILIQRFKDYRRKGLQPEALADEELLEVFSALADGRISRGGVRPVLIRMMQLRASGCASSLFETALDQALRPLNGQRIDEGALRQRIAKAEVDLDGARFPARAERDRFLMGRLMTDLKGRVEGRDVARLVSPTDKS